MAGEGLFLDTGFVVARFYRTDQYHEVAKTLARRLEQCVELWTTDAILLEVAAAFSDPPWRVIAGRFWDQFHTDPRCRFVTISGSLLERAVRLFRDRPDKSWSLTDCISFLVMTDQHLHEALTCDHHFVQAGFRALMLEPVE
jgi:predicted nucleic acid-binding protein